MAALEGHILTLKEIVELERERTAEERARADRERDRADAERDKAEAIAAKLLVLRANSADQVAGFERNMAELRALVDDGNDALPFAGAMGLFFMSYTGIAVSLWPYLVPRHYTIWESASSEGTQAFLLIGTLFLLPVILMYTGWSYWVFRGKMRGDVGYH